MNKFLIINLFFLIMIYYYFEEFKYIINTLTFYEWNPIETFPYFTISLLQTDKDYFRYNY